MLQGQNEKKHLQLPQKSLDMKEKEKGHRGRSSHNYGINYVVLSYDSCWIMWKRGNIRTTHHIVPRHEWGTNDDDNLIRLKEWPHQALHILHETRLVAEQLLHTLDLNAKAMRPEVVKWLVDTLTQKDPRDLDFWYKDSTHF